MNLIAATAMAALLAVANAGQGTPLSRVTMRTIDKGAESNIDSARQVTARTAAEWAALWKTHAFDRPLPTVDFSREMVIGVFMGSRPTAGFALEIVGAVDEGGTLVVTYRETTPPSGVVTAQVLVAPYHLVAVPKHTEMVRFEKVETEK
jgi:hypothetical protein